MYFLLAILLQFICNGKYRKIQIQNPITLFICFQASNPIMAVGHYFDFRIPDTVNEASRSVSDLCHGVDADTLLYSTVLSLGVGDPRGFPD